MDKQRERLVELLIEYDTMRMMRHSIEDCAEQLLSKGVIVPPCKVGDYVWYFDEESRQLVKGKVDGYLWFRSCGFALNVIWEKPIMGHFSYCRKEMPFSEVGKTVFLAKEEAEEALKGGGADA